MLKKNTRVRPSVIIAYIGKLGKAETFRKSGERSNAAAIYAAEDRLRAIVQSMDELTMWDLKTLTIAFLDLGNFSRGMD